MRSLTINLASLISCVYLNFPKLHVQKLYWIWCQILFLSVCSSVCLCIYLYVPTLQYIDDMWFLTHPGSTRGPFTICGGAIILWQRGSFYVKQRLLDWKYNISWLSTFLFCLVNFHKYALPCWRYSCVCPALANAVLAENSFCYGLDIFLYFMTLVTLYCIYFRVQFLLPWNGVITLYYILLM